MYNILDIMTKTLIILIFIIKVVYVDIISQLVSGTHSTLNYNNAFVIYNANKHKFQFTNNVFS